MLSKRPDHDWVFIAEVLEWHDGDSVVVNTDRGRRIYTVDAVRLIGIDTPETRGRLRWGTRELAQLALQRSVELAPIGSFILVRTHKNKKDKYGRWLAEVWGPAQTMSVNLTLLKEKLARVYGGGKR